MPFSSRRAMPRAPRLSFVIPIARLAEMPQGPAVVVPHDRLTPEALRSVAEEFVTREGTDYGPVERSLEVKVQTLLRQIASGEAAIVYDGASDRTHIEADSRGPAPWPR